MNLRRASRGNFGNIVIWVVIVAFGAGVLLLFTPNLSNSFINAENETANTPAVTVNGETVNMVEFNRAYENTVNQYIQFYQQFGQDFSQRLEGAEGAYYGLELRSQVVDQLVRQQLLTQQINERGISVSNAEVETSMQVQLENTLSQANLTEQQADEILRQQGSSLRQYKTALRTQISDQLKQDALREQVVGDLNPTDEQLLEYVEENEDRFKTQLTETETPTEEEIQAEFDANADDYVELKARHILISVAEDASEEEDQETLAQIQDIKKQLDEGAAFEDLAQEFSDDATNASRGGDLGVFGRGRMVAPFEEAAYALEVGQVSDPVKTQFGYHLILVEERLPQAFEDVQGQIETDLTEARQTAAFTELLDNAKAGDADALTQIRDGAESNYLTDKENEKFEQWVSEITATADIDIQIPEVVAFREEQEDQESGLAAYEALKMEGASNDPYLDYYIGRIYQEKHTEASETLQELQALEEPTSEEQSEIERLTGEVETLRQLAANGILATAERQGITAASADLYEQVINLGDAEPSVRYRYAQTLLFSNNRSRALSELQRAIEQDDAYVPALELYADLMVENFNYGIAVTNYEKALAGSDPDSRTARNIRLKLAQAYLGDDQYDKAQEFFGAVLADDAENATALMGIGDLYFEQNEFESALEYYQKAKAQSARSEIQIKLGNTYAELERLEQAETEYEGAKQKDPYAVAAYKGLGEVYQSLDRTARALEEFEEGFLRARSQEDRTEMGELVLALNPEDLTTRFKLAELYKQQHVYQKAIEHYTEILNQDPNSIAGYWGLAESYDGRADYETAKTYYKSALTIETASTQDKIKTYEDIIAVEGKIVGFGNTPGPDGLDAYLEIARLYVEDGNREEAETYLDDLADYDETYRAEETSAIREQIAQAIANLPGDEIEDQGRNHIPEGETVSDYNSIPPTSGPHYGLWLRWGLYTVPIRNEYQIHNLEHGGVIVQYDPDLDPTVVAQIVELLRLMGPANPKMIMAPYPGLDANIALTAWNHIDKFDEYDEGRIRAFVGEYINQGPEATAYDGGEWWNQPPFEREVLNNEPMDNGQ